jgi:hypothetical protein
MVKTKGCYSPEMKMDLSVEAEELTGVCRNIFGDESRWITADGYPHSLALCIIDSIYATSTRRARTIKQ